MDALENLDVWRRGCVLCIDVYRTMAACRDFGFKDQITRSALSIPSNIAEGYEKNSRKEFVRYLRIAKGSCGELWTQLYIGMQVGFVDADGGERFRGEAAELSRMLQGLIRRYQRTIV